MVSEGLEDAASLTLPPFGLREMNSPWTQHLRSERATRPGPRNRKFSTAAVMWFAQSTSIRNIKEKETAIHLLLLLRACIRSQYCHPTVRGCALCSLYGREEACVCTAPCRPHARGGSPPFSEGDDAGTSPRGVHPAA